VTQRVGNLGNLGNLWIVFTLFLAIFDPPPLRGDESDTMPHSDLALFTVVVEIDVAWGDMDSYGHVNNVVYFRYFENVRIAYLDRVGWSASKQTTGLGPILHSTSARFRKAVTYPDRLQVGARVADIQSDRVVFEFRLVSEKLNAVACEGQGVIVSYDYRADAKAPIPEGIRAAILELEGRK
jgi:acyl-CoA thioester hydrolase